ncbi:MAG: hypothetical protein HQ494_11445 [Rhodospirillales bacterium]|nr:hypothetical protein [Rhodospirillales bacterium]
MKPMNIALQTNPPSKGLHPASLCSLPHSEPDMLGCGLRLGADTETAGISDLAPSGG